MPTLETRRAHTTNPDPAQAMAELRAALHERPSAVLLFTSPDYPLDELGRAIRDAFPCPVVGCTTAGQIGPSGYETGGITAASVSGGEFTLTPHLIHPLTGLGSQVEPVIAAIRRELDAAPPEMCAAGFVLVDGLSLLEERLMTTLYSALPGLHLVGGSAGDALRFQRTCVYHDGRFLSDAATLALVQSTEIIEPFRFQHYEPTPVSLVVTSATMEQRLVHELNGIPATRAYGRALGVDEQKVGPDQFAASPLMWKAGDQWFIRSIQRGEPDGSLRFYCAVDRGSVLRVGTPRPVLETLEAQVARLRARFASLDLLLGFDCIERRIEAEQHGVLNEVGALLNELGTIGFSTYGEQFNALHINRTLVGLAVGRKHAA